MVIHRYEFDIEDKFSLNLPFGSTVLSAQMVRGKSSLYVLLDPTMPKKIFYFKVYGTGHPCSSKPENYIDTIQENDNLIWHIFHD